MFGLYLSYAAGEAATGKSNVDSRKKYDNSPHFSKTSIAAPPDPAALPGKQLLLRPEPEQLFGVSCKSSCAARAQRLGTAATQAWDSCPGGLTRTIVVLNPEDPGAAARDGSDFEEVTGSIAWYRTSAARITRTIIRVTPKDSRGRCCVPGGRLHRESTGAITRTIHRVISPNRPRKPELTGRRYFFWDLQRT